MIKIELIYDLDCPNIEDTRANLKKSLKSLAIDNTWIEWERSQAHAPTYTQHYGSPTILINGIPIGKKGVNDEGNSCCIYFNEQGGISRVPSVDQIRIAIQMAIQKKKPWSIIGILSSSGSCILSLLPVISCPLCWSTYVSFLSILGIGFFNYSPYLVPLITGLIGFVCFSLWRDYHFHKRIISFLFALIGGALIVFEKIIYPYNPLMYTGIACLVVARIVNIFYVKKMTKQLGRKS